jgi:hypothetical protein
MSTCLKLDQAMVKHNMENTMSEASAFKQEWEAKKLLKRAKKKAKHALEKQGFGRNEASKAVNTAVNRISVKPERKSAGRGR